MSRFAHRDMRLGRKRTWNSATRDGHQIPSTFVSTAKKMASFRDLLRDTKSRIREVDTADRGRGRLGRPGTVVLDVREPDEYEQGALPGAIHIPRGHLESQVEGRVTDHDAPIVVYCAGGTRSAFAADTLDQLGYTDVVSVVGGFNKWKDEGRPWRTPASLTPEQRNRYQRHLLLPEVDVAGQHQAARLEGPAARRRRPRLAGRPVPGRGRCRHPRHHRHGRRRRLQPAAPDPAQHGPDRRAQGRLGQEDADRRSTPTSTWSPTTCASGADNVLDIFDGYDVIVDGTDNFPTRYLVNDASLKLDIPVVHGSIFRFEGQASVYLPAPGSLLPLPGARAAAGRAGTVVRRGRRARRAARASSAASRPWRPSSSCSVSATRWSAACWPTTPSRRASARSRSTATPSARRAASPRSSSSSPSTTSCACRTRSQRAGLVSTGEGLRLAAAPGRSPGAAGSVTWRHGQRRAPHRLRHRDQAGLHRRRPERTGTRTTSSAQPGSYPYTRGIYPTMYRGRPVDDPPVLRLRHGGGDQRAVEAAAGRRADRAVVRLRPAHPDGLRLRPPAGRGRGRQGRAWPSTPSTTCASCWAACRSTRSPRR